MLVYLRVRIIISEAQMNGYALYINIVSVFAIQTFVSHRAYQANA